MIYDFGNIFSHLLLQCQLKSLIKKKTFFAPIIPQPALVIFDPTQYRLEFSFAFSMRASTIDSNFESRVAFPLAYRYNFGNFFPHSLFSTPIKKPH